MDGKAVAIATQITGRISYEEAAAVAPEAWARLGRDALEQIRGAHVDPTYAERVDGALSVLLAHRADCGFYPGRVPGLEWMQLAGFIERRNSVLGRPPGRMATRWVREWQ